MLLRTGAYSCWTSKLGRCSTRPCPGPPPRCRACASYCLHLRCWTGAPLSLLTPSPDRDRSVQPGCPADQDSRGGQLRLRIGRPVRMASAARAAGASVWHFSCLCGERRDGRGAEGGGLLCGGRRSVSPRPPAATGTGRGPLLPASSDPCPPGGGPLLPRFGPGQRTGGRCAAPGGRRIRSDRSTGLLIHRETTPHATSTCAWPSSTQAQPIRCICSCS